MTHVWPNTVEDAVSKLVASGMKGMLTELKTYDDIPIRAGSMKRKDWEDVFRSEKIQKLCGNGELNVKDILLKLRTAKKRKSAMTHGIRKNALQHDFTRTIRNVCHRNKVWEKKKINEDMLFLCNHYLTHILSQIVEFSKKEVGNTYTLQHVSFGIQRVFPQNHTDTGYLHENISKKIEDAISHRSRISNKEPALSFLDYIQSCKHHSSK